MKNLFSFLFFALLIAPLGLQAKEQTKEQSKNKYRFAETVYVPLPQNALHKWKLGFQKADEEKGSAVTRYILETETTKEWSQLLNIQFKDKSLVKVESAEAAMRAEADKSRVVNHKVHSQNPHDVLYERQFPTGEHEIVRMIMTKKGLHRVAFVKKGPITKEERTQWVERLSKGMIGGKDG